MSKQTKDLTPLDQEVRTHITTEEAARHLLRKAQTLRTWSCRDDGPVRPARIGGRLAWPVADIKRVMGLAQ